MLIDFELKSNEGPRRVIRVLTSEDSRIFRIWNHNKFVSRIVSKHNDIVTRVLKVPEKNMFISGGKDGSIKCFYGKVN